MQKNRVMLVADDIDVNRASFRAMFEEEYEVLEAGDGNETLKILEERKVDIVILDMCMPVKSGKQVLKQMKADPKLLDIPVIVKTVIGEERELEMLEMGADDFIFSPCEPERRDAERKHGVGSAEHFKQLRWEELEDQKSDRHDADGIGDRVA